MAGEVLAMASDHVNSNPNDDDDYDEEADSDFNDQVSNDDGSVTSEEQHDDRQVVKQLNSTQQRVDDLDSGDEATIKERKRSKKKQKRNQNGGYLSSEGEQDEQWRAKTRSMRAQDDLERRKRPITDIKTSTIDVNKLWEEMNKPGPLPPLKIEGQTDVGTTINKQEASVQKTNEKERVSSSVVEETITIKRQFKFAGEVHTEEKVVPKSSAEARLWLAQQENNKKVSEKEDIAKQRPTRKISRFDPNYSNLEAFRNHAIKAQHGTFKGPKLNVVEKSKMDWAAHVDTEGLKEELDKHAKAKDAYLDRMDFLGQVGQRKDDEAKQARQRG